MRRLLFLFSILVVLIALGIGIWQFFVVRKAHSTFANYYVFRGCTQLLQRTSTYGICKIASGKTIRIVLYKGKWYLDGDLPVCYFGHCL